MKEYPVMVWARPRGAGPGGWLLFRWQQIASDLTACRQRIFALAEQHGYELGAVNIDFGSARPIGMA